MAIDYSVPDITELVSKIAVEMPINVEKTAGDGLSVYYKARNEYSRVHGSAKGLEGLAYRKALYDRHCYAWEMVTNFYKDKPFPLRS